MIKIAFVIGVPVVEGIGAPIKMAALLVSLGLRHSRLRWPKEVSQPRSGRRQIRTRLASVSRATATA